MQLASYILSLCLHAAVLLLIWFWPGQPPLRLDQRPVMISLVEGAPGGNRMPSPILGHMGEPAEGKLAPTAPAPQSEIAAPARETAKPEPAPTPPREAAPEPKKPEAVPIPRKPEAKPEPKPEPRPEPKKEEPKKEEVKPKPEPKKEEAKPKPEPPKQEKKPDKKEEKPAPKKTDPVAQALQQARKSTSRVQSGDRGNAIEQALAQAQRRAGGNRGGGGGEGDGPGGGGLGDVYMGQVMLAVRPNWGFASAGRVNLACVVKVKVDMEGKVLQAVISQSSGNAQYDASAVNAVVRTGQAGEFPPPPSPEYMDLDLVFTYDELMGRR